MKAKAMPYETEAPDDPTIMERLRKRDVDAGTDEAASSRRVSSVIIAYLILGFSTFAWTYNHNEPTSCIYKCDYENSVRGFNSVISGVLWPIYWTGRFFLAVIR